MKLKKLEARHYEWSSDAPVDFNIHYHEGKEVFYPVKHDGVRQYDASPRSVAEEAERRNARSAGALSSTAAGAAKSDATDDSDDDADENAAVRN